MRIVTTYRPHPSSNVGNIVAKGRGMQKTTRWDQSKRADENHGIAAANLVLAMADKGNSWVVGDVVENITEGNASHDSNDSGTRHTFEV